MATPYLIIDGYNLLHAAGLALANYAQGDLQRQRHRLLVLIAGSLSTEERQRCTVVFDAIDAPTGLDREFQHEGIAVLFAEPGHEADEVIEQLVARHTAAKNLIVVSSDRRLQRAARIRRAGCLDSEAFHRQITRRSQTGGQPNKPGSTNTPPKPTASRPTTPSSEDREVAYWQREFGNIDVSSLVRDDEREAAAQSSDPWQQQVDDLQRLIDDAEDVERWLNNPPGQDRSP